MDKKKYTLREKKFAKTKIALMNAFIERLQKTRFENISIREVCDSVEISEGTFYNYFPQKVDLIHYFTQLLSLKVIWRVYKKRQGKNYLDLIDIAFAVLMEEFNNPNLMYEIITIMISQKTEPQQTDISEAERYYAFPECIGIETAKLPVMLFDDFFRDCLENAVKNRGLPKSTNLKNIIVCLKTIMVGTPIAVTYDNFKYIGKYYKQQLSILWKGLSRKK